MAEILAWRSEAEMAELEADAAEIEASQAEASVGNLTAGEGEEQEDGAGGKDVAAAGEEGDDEGELSQELEAQLVQIPSLLKTIADENEANECWCSVVFWLLNAAFYIWVLDSQFRIKHSYEMSQALKDSVASMSTPDGMDMYGVRDYQSLWQWISDAAVPAIYDFTDYEDENLDAWDRNYLGEYNRVVGGLFLLQNRGHRFDSSTCETAHTSFFPVCYDGSESKVPYGISCNEDTEWPEGSGEFPYKDGYCDTQNFDKQQVLMGAVLSFPSPGARHSVGFIAAPAPRKCDSIAVPRP